MPLLASKLDPLLHFPVNAIVQVIPLVDPCFREHWVMSWSAVALDYLASAGVKLGKTLADTKVFLILGAKMVDGSGSRAIFTDMKGELDPSAVALLPELLTALRHSAT